MIYVLIIYQDNEPDKLIGYLNSNGIICQSFSISQIQDNFYEQYKLFDIIIFENVSNPEIENKIKYSIPIISIYNDKIKFSHTNEYLVLDYKSSLNELILLIIKSLVRIAHKDDTIFAIQNLLNNSTEAAIILENNTIIYANPKFCSLVKKETEDIVNSNISSYLLPKDFKNFNEVLSSDNAQFLANFNNNHQLFEVTRNTISRDNYFYHILTLKPVIESPISEFWFNLFETFLEPLRIMDLDGNVIYANNEYAKLFELPLEEIIGKHFTTVYSNDYKSKIYATNKNKFYHRKLNEAKLNVVLHNGKTKYLFRKDQEIFIQGKKCILTILKDLTTEKELQQDAKKKSELLTLILTLSSSIIFTNKDKLLHIFQSALNLLSSLFEVDYAMLSINTDVVKSTQNYLGKDYNYFKHKFDEKELDMFIKDRNEIINYPFNKNSLPENIINFISNLGLTSHLSFPIIFKDNIIGYFVFISFSKVIIWDNEDVNILLIFSDLIAGNLEKVKTEYLLEYERKKLYDIFENMNTGILTCDDNFDILFYNKKANELLGLDTTKNLIELATILKAKKGKEILYNKEYEFYHKLLENNLNKNIENIEVFYNGKTRYINAYISNFGENNKLYLITIIDETEKVKLQTELTLSQKLEAVGRLAAGIAHEINTPMQFINDNLTFLKDSCLSFNDFINEILSYYKNDDKFIELLQKYDIDYLKDEVITAINESFDGVERIIKIVTAMKEFSHTSGFKEKTLVNINKIIETTLTISRNVWKYHSNLKSELDENLPFIECNSDEIGQVLLNMIVNSAHAIEEKFKDTGQKGIIEIKTWQEDNFIVISIKDNGKGIKEEHLNRIYDPFFTTKEVGKGTGQGLAIAHDIIVNKHNGNIQCNSVYGEGTEFLIFLPIKVQNGKEI